MWQALGKLFAKVAVYCMEHPDQVIAVVNDVKAAKK